MYNEKKTRSLFSQKRISYIKKERLPGLVLQMSKTLPYLACNRRRRVYSKQKAMNEAQASMNGGTLDKLSTSSIKLVTCLSSEESSMYGSMVAESR